MNKEEMNQSPESEEEVSAAGVEPEVELVTDEEMMKELSEEESTENSEETSETEEDDMIKLAKALVLEEQKAKEAADRYQRTMAEFDNFRKRTLKEKSQMFESGAKEVLEKLLPVVDNFERAIDHIGEDEKDLAVTQGVEMIYKQLMGTLAELGVEEIEALHQEFDPELHHAVSHEENEDWDDNTVMDVFQKGYKYKDSVLRYSMVKVVN